MNQNLYHMISNVNLALISFIINDFSLTLFWYPKKDKRKWWKDLKITSFLPKIQVSFQTS